MKIHLQGIHRALPLGVVVLLLALAGCAWHRTYLVPAPSANLTNGGHAVTASSDGIAMTVTPNSWNGQPRNLDKHLTPLEVRIENHSKQPLRIAYEDFKLVTPEGKTLAALPPSEITGTEYEGENRIRFDPHIVDAAWQRRGGRVGRIPRRPTRIILTPGFSWYGFYFAPYWNYGYAGIGPWPYPWYPNFGYYSYYYPYMRAVHLPTRSMLRKGIPEGVVAPGGYVEGFLYFQRVGPEMKTVDFVATLQGAQNGEKIGTIRVPFRVETTAPY